MLDDRQSRHDDLLPVPVVSYPRSAAVSHRTNITAHMETVIRKDIEAWLRHENSSLLPGMEPLEAVDVLVGLLLGERTLGRLHDDIAKSKQNENHN